MNSKNTSGRHPSAWIPTLFFAEGLPNYAVTFIAIVMYKSFNITNDRITFWTGLLGLAWVIKPLWSPLIETARSKKSVVIWFQLIGGVSLGLVALTLHLPVYFAASIAVLGLVAIASATHDIAADGLYIASLTDKQQAAYAGWIGAFYNAAKFVAAGGLVILAGYFEKQMSVSDAWGIIFGLLAAIMILLALYHFWTLPAAQNAPVLKSSGSGGFAAFRIVFIDFFKKPGIWLAILFIIMFRAGEAQVTTIGPLFLREARALGGLGLSTEDLGWVYGTTGTIAFIGGSIVGGYFAAWLGLKRSMLALILAMNFPNIAFFFLSHFLPTNLMVIAGAVGVEMFGFGFGYVGVMLFIMQVVSVGKYQTAHYAIGTGIMALGLVLFKTVSGEIQVALGYQNFFVWVLIAAIPVLILSRFVPLDRSLEQGSTEPAAGGTAS